MSPVGLSISTQRWIPSIIVPRSMESWRECGMWISADVHASSGPRADGHLTELLMIDK
jgi:hypothetical protein